MTNRRECGYDLNTHRYILHLVHTISVAQFLRVRCGKQKVIFSFLELILVLVLNGVDSEIVVTTILERANEILLRAHNNVEKALPHPSLGLRLPNHVEASSNLFVIQKFFEGSFQFDVFFESSNSRQRLDCMIFVTVIYSRLSLQISGNP